MKQLLFIKEKIKKFVGKNDVFIIPALKFLLTFVTVLQINKELGFMHKISSMPVSLVVGLAGSFLPMNLTIVILGLISLAHVFTLSKECALIVFALFLILYLLYFRFASKDAFAVLLTPIAFMFNVPYAVPVSMGLVGSPTSLVSVGSGVIVYNVLHYISENAEVIKEMGTASSKINGIKDVTVALLTNKSMIVLVVSFAITIIIVHIIRKMSIKYSWFIAIGVGAMTCFIVTVFANRSLGGNISAGEAFAGMLISLILNIILQYFCFDLDYNRTEKVQFEDDEYYYYVKAVPKNTIKFPEDKKAVAKKRSQQPQRVARPVTPEDKSRNEARAAVRRTAANHAQKADKGFMGLKGGRPAGEGRLKEQAARERAAQARAARERAATQRIIDDFSDNK